VPQVPVFGTWVLGWPFLSVEIVDAGGTQTNLRQGPSPLHHFQLLPTAATAENRADTRHFRERACEDSRRDGISSGRYVVMPEHVHLLISEPKEGTPSTVLQKLKLRVARKLRKRGRHHSAGQLCLTLPLEKAGEPLRAFWQARFHDFNVYTTGKRKEKLNYMHANPVVRGLVEHPKDWRWSSWSFYVLGKPGLVGIDVVPE
jgi:putative transposase